MTMPEALQALCNICEIPEQNHPYQDDQFDPNETRVVTKPDGVVGHYHCGELDELGKDGKLPKASCHLFQQMIYADELCGCAAAAIEADNGALVYVAAESQDEVLSADPSLSNSVEPVFDTVSGSSSQALTITLGGAAISAVTMLTAFS